MAVLMTNSLVYVDEEGIEHHIEIQPGQKETPRMVWNPQINEEECPYCHNVLRDYEGLRICYCKFCGGKILR